jgi:hypothetical protein
MRFILMHGMEHKKFIKFIYSVKCKAIPVEAYIGPEGSRRLRVPGFSDNWQIKVARLSALCTGHLNTSGRTLVLISVKGWLTLDPHCSLKD